MKYDEMFLHFICSPARLFLCSSVLRDPDWIQTNDLLLRRQLLYSAELPGLKGCKDSKKMGCEIE